MAKSTVSKIVSGDRVQYKAEFLRSIGCYTGDMPFAKGRVMAVKNYGGMTLAEIEWNKPDIPNKVNINNLKRLKDVEPG